MSSYGLLKIAVNRQVAFVVGLQYLSRDKNSIIRFTEFVRFGKILLLRRRDCQCLTFTNQASRALHFAWQRRGISHGSEGLGAISLPSQ